MWNASAPVVVGIDGSDAAVHAALWAIEEAADRNVVLKLVHAVGTKDSSAHPEGTLQMEVQYAEESLREAAAAVKATEIPVKLETEILWGVVEQALLDETRNATLMCVGSTGIGAVARRFLGSTASALAEKAFCPVAIIRRTGHAEEPSCIVVIEDRVTGEKLIEHAMAEARLRRLPVLLVAAEDAATADAESGALKRIEELSKHYPDVPIHAVTTPSALRSSLADDMIDSVKLVVIGAPHADWVTDLVGPHERTLIPRDACSVLVVR